MNHQTQSSIHSAMEIRSREWNLWLYVSRRHRCIAFLVNPRPQSGQQMRVKPLGTVPRHGSIWCAPSSVYVFQWFSLSFSFSLSLFHFQNNIFRSQHHAPIVAANTHEVHFQSDRAGYPSSREEGKRATASCSRSYITRVAHTSCRQSIFTSIERAAERQ